MLQSGFLSKQFDKQQGCRQGDPVTPYLFILCAEILAILIKQNTDIKGIFIDNINEHKISQYTDDASLALDGSPISLFAALQTCTIDFNLSFSGLKVNIYKTKIIWINWFKKQFLIRYSCKMEVGLGLNSIQFIRHSIFSQSK